MKKVFLILFFAIGAFVLGKEIFSYSFAYQYKVDDSILFYKDNYQELELDIKEYLNNIDNFIIPNSSFIYSDKLLENYDFLTHFALDYVLNNKEIFDEQIKVRDKFSYIDKSSIKRETNLYVSLDAIYDITDFYFGVNAFVIINDDVNIDNDYITLTDYASDEFKFEIEEISVTDSNYGIEALVLYENGDNYLYSFSINNNILKIQNVEVVS